MAEKEQTGQTALQRHIVQLALELAAQLESQADQAPVGEVVSACEDLLLDRGRQFLRDSLAATLQQRIDHDEKKGGRLAPVPVVTPAATRALPPVSSSPPWDPFACSAPLSSAPPAAWEATPLMNASASTAACPHAPST